MNNQNEAIEHFKNAIAELWSRDGQNTWPIEINSIVHLFMDIFVEELFSDIHRLREQGWEEKQIAARFQTASRILRLIMPCVLGMKFSRKSVEDIRRRVIYLLNLVKHLKSGDLSNREGKNLIYAPHEIPRQVNEGKMKPADKKDSLAVHKLCAILWNYAETLCFKLHGVIRQFHGPYRLPGKDEEILIRDFIHLNPTDLWEETRTIPYKSIRVVTAYRHLPFAIDVYDNVTIRNGSTYIGTLSSYYLEADGKLLEPEEIHPLCDLLSDVMISVTGKVEGMDWKQLAKKYADIFWYSKKELREETGEDWHCPPIVDERIKTGEISNKLQSLEPQALQRMLRISF